MQQQQHQVPIQHQQVPIQHQVPIQQGHGQIPQPNVQGHPGHGHGVQQPVLDTSNIGQERQ